MGEAPPPGDVTVADLQTITIASGSGDTVETGITKLYADLAKASNCFSDTSDPSSPAEGRVWWRSDEQKGYIWTSAAKAQIVMLHTLTTDLDFNGNEAQTLHLEELATGSLPTPGAAQESRLEYDSTLQYATLTTDANNFYLAHMNANAGDYVAISCDLNVSAAATAATADTNTRLGGWLMDATAEELNFVAKAPVPEGWTGANDLLLKVCFLLSAAETAADDVDMDCNWLSLTAASGDGSDKTATAASTVNYDIGGTAIAQYDMHTLTVTIDHDDATNPVVAGDYISGYLQRNTVGGAGKVAGIIVVSATLLVPSFRIAWGT